MSIASFFEREREDEDASFFEKVEVEVIADA